MTKTRNLLSAAALALGSATMAHADNGVTRTADHNGAFELTTGNYSKASRVLAASQRVSPEAPDILLNLAQLSLRNGRPDAARDLYRRVLAQPEDEMLMAGGQWRSSHLLAQAGLQAISGTQMVSR